MEPRTPLIPCGGCGALVPDTNGATHAYIGASPGCWAICGEILAREYGEFHYPEVHRLTVDAYAAQHPGVPSRRSIQSVAVHLMGLYFALEVGSITPITTAAIGRLAKLPGAFTWLEPPAYLGDITVLDVVQARDLKEHERLVNLWARAVWQAWAVHHPTIRRWSATLL